MIKAMFQSAPRRRAVECAADVREGRALLVDVREPREWESGVADGAALLPLSDLTGSKKAWTEFLRGVGEREVLVYCAAGGRSAIAARMLRNEGVKAGDAGALHEWRAAGWKITPPKAG